MALHQQGGEWLPLHRASSEDSEQHFFSTAKLYSTSTPSSSSEDPAAVKPITSGPITRLELGLLLLYSQDSFPLAVALAAATCIYEELTSQEMQRIEAGNPTINHTGSINRDNQIREMGNRAATAGLVIRGGGGGQIMQLQRLEEANVTRALQDFIRLKERIEGWCFFDVFEILCS